MSNLQRLGRIPKEGEGHRDERETKRMEEKEREIAVIRAQSHLLGAYITQTGIWEQGREEQVFAILSLGP